MQALETMKRVAIRNILLAMDFSPESEAALQYAEAVARRFDSKLFVAHVIEPSEDTYVPGGGGLVTYQMVKYDARKELDRLDKRLEKFPHEMILKRGEAASVLRDLTTTVSADLVVLGTHGRSGIRRLVMGSVAEEVFRQAPCAALTVGPKVTSDAPREIDFPHILYATDFSPESLAAAPFAACLAQEFESQLTFLNVVKLPLEPMESEQAIIGDREKKLQVLIPPDIDLWCEPKVMVRFGDAGEVITEVAQALKADLIVLGVRGAGGSLGVATHISRAAAHEVVSHAKCPVLTLRG
jgi:nucleotide-binding universal stress UspA family protein